MSANIASYILGISQRLALYAGYSTFLIGIIGNILNVITFTSLKVFRKNPSTLYFLTESISNTAQLTFLLANSILRAIYEADFAYSNLYWCKFRGICIALSTMISFYEVCSSSYDQFLSTSHHYQLRQMSTLKLAKILTSIAIFLAISQSLLFGIFVELRHPICATFNAFISKYFYYFYYPVLTGLLPIFIASLFSILAYQNVRHITRLQIPIVRRRLDKQLTAMVLIRVMMYVILTLPYSINRIYLYVGNVNPSNAVAYAINALVANLTYVFFNINYAFSFYAFLITSGRFRRQVKYLLFKKIIGRFNRICCSHENQIRPILEGRSTDSSYGF